MPSREVPHTATVLRSSHSLLTTADGLIEPASHRTSDQGLESTSTIRHPNLTRGLLRHIPRGARSVAGHLLTEIIDAILRDPLKVDGWRRLLTFGVGTLEVPVRGGRRHSLTLYVKKRVNDFRDGWIELASTLFLPGTTVPDERNRSRTGGERSRAAAVAAKLEDGNIGAAARILCSDETPAPVDKETLELLRQKHPTPPSDRPAIPSPISSTPFQTTDAEIRAMIRSFPMGSAGGPDGLRPQHVVELIGDPDAGPGLLKATTALVNLLLAGVCPQELRPILFGGTLFALRKSSGGLRPIAIGYVWRRLASKCANAYAIPRLTSLLSPKQLGVGVPGGCEAAVHATRRFLNNMEPGNIIVKLDISNAFNSLRRDRMLASLDEAIPELAAYCHLAYADSTTLKFGSFTLQSHEGPQQGDPLGPLLFCLPLQPTLIQLSSPLAFGYLDDLTLGGSPEVVEADVDLIERECADLGLKLNRVKCELISIDYACSRGSSLSQFSRVHPSSATLLGAPLLPAGALLTALDASIATLEMALNRLQTIPRQDALLLLRCSLGSPRLIHLLRCAVCCDHSRLRDYDEKLRGGVERILNVQMTDVQWAQATLPIRMGGLGIRKVSSLALPAFLASAASTLSTQNLILGKSVESDDTAYISALSRWRQMTEASESEVADPKKQSHWDEPLLKDVSTSISDASQDPYDQARLRATQFPHASAWLHALPLASFNLKLDNEAVRVAVGLRLGLAICEPHICPCGASVSARGSHGLSCSLGFGRQARHSNINNLIFLSLNKAGVPAIKEPAGLNRTDGKRPDGLTLVPWTNGRCLLWDATVVDTLAASYILASASEAGGAAELAAKRKIDKYAELQSNYNFVPVAVETLGPINSEGLNFISELGRRLTSITGDIRETSFLHQSLSVTVQRFNAVAFQGTLSKLPDGAERRVYRK